MAKLSPATKAVATQRLRSLGGRVGVEMPDDADLAEGARSKWVWSLSLLSLSLTCKAIGWLQRAMADQADWDAAVAARRRRPFPGRVRGDGRVVIEKIQ